MRKMRFSRGCWCSLTDGGLRATGGTPPVFLGGLPSEHARRSTLRSISTSLLILGVTACGSVSPRVEHVRDDVSEVGAQLSIRWSKQLSEGGRGSFAPSEGATPLLDPERSRVYVGSSAGAFFSFDIDGGEVFRYQSGAAIESGAVLTRDGHVVFASEDGVVHALDAENGALLWKAELEAVIRATPIFHQEHLYFVSESDQVIAVEARTGEVLWTYAREAVEADFSMAGHAGLAGAPGMVITGFTDGAIVALDAEDGTVRWERETLLDAEAEEDDRFRLMDADATPVVVGNTVFAASAHTGLYTLDLATGSVLSREPIAGVVGLAVAPASEWTHGKALLLITSAEDGVLAMDQESHEIVWRRALPRGVTSTLVLTRHVLLVAESAGSLLALNVRDGAELGRLDEGRGFSSAPAVKHGFGWVVTNGARLIAFRLTR